MEVHCKFLEILETKGLVRIGELSELSGGIGIDAEFWLSSIIPADRKSEMMGSISMSLRPSIQHEVNRLISLNFNPLFVYPGIPLLEKANTNSINLWPSSEPETLHSLSELPKKYLDFPYISSELFRFLGCRTSRATFLASSQLANLLLSGQVNHILGKSDLLFHPVPRIIIEIMQTRYKYIECKEVFDSLKVSQLELKQAFVLTGYLGQVNCGIELSSLLDSLKFVSLDQITDQVQQVNRVINAIDCSIAFNDPTFNLTPNDLCSQIKNPKIFEALDKLNLSPLNFLVLTQNKFFEKPPTADSNNYRRLIRSLNDIKSITASILLNASENSHNQISIKVQNWFSNIEDELRIKQLNLINWKITSENLHQALIAQKKNFPDLQFCLKWHIDDFDHNKDLISPHGLASTYSFDCIQSKILFTFLESIGYIFSNGIPTLFGNSFLKVDPEWQQSAFYLQELLKYGMLNGRTLSQSQVSQRTDEEIEKLYLNFTDDSSRHAFLLISRVFSLVQPTLKEEVWNGEVDFDLAQFHSLVFAIFKNYQQLYEGIVLKEFLTQEFSFDDLQSIIAKSPLLPVPNPALGIAVKRLLIFDDVEKVASEMPHMADLFLDLQRGWMFWKNFVKIMGVFIKFNAVPENSFIDEITNASKKLKQVLMRARVRINN